MSLIPGFHGLPKVALRHASGASAEVYLHGAHVASWKNAAGEELLFLSRESAFAAGKPIRGGIPLCWPQFSGQGPLPQHGLVRTEDWTLLGTETLADGAVQATLRLTETPETLAQWRHPFAVELRVTLREETLTVAFTAANTGEQPFNFQMAFHTYFRVADIHRAAVRGLQGLTYLDAVREMAPTPETGAEIRFTEETDRIYLNAPDTLQVIDEAVGRAITIEKRHLPDVVVWNPWIAKAQRMPDFGDDEYQQMVCAETARIVEPYELAPGQTWTGETTFRCG